MISDASYGRDDENAEHLKDLLKEETLQGVNFTDICLSKHIKLTRAVVLNPFCSLDP